MTNIYEHTDYREFLRAWLKSQPHQGRGLLGAWARELGVHSTLMSQVLGGSKELNLENADGLAGLLHLSEPEADYFLLMVQWARAGSPSLRKRWRDKMEQARKKSQVIAERLKDAQKMTEEARVSFYSSWLYAGVRNLTALPDMNSADEIARHLQMPRNVIQDVIEFLVSHGLCVPTDKGLDVGPRRTHLAATSPLVQKHHQNWRLEGFRRMNWRRDEDLFFTFPMSLSRADAGRLRQLLPKWIEDVHGIVGPSPSETVRCLNIDFFEY